MGCCSLPESLTIFFQAIAEFQQFEGDTGSTPVQVRYVSISAHFAWCIVSHPYQRQVAVLTTRIKNTQAHTTANRKVGFS